MKPMIILSHRHSGMRLVYVVLAVVLVCSAHFTLAPGSGPNKAQAQPMTTATVTPSSGPIAGGTEITITGDGIKPGNTAFKSMSSSLYHTCAISEDNEVYCWGLGASGQLGNGDVADSSVPVRVLTSDDDPDSALPGGVAIEFIAAGVSNTCAATASDIYCWGADSYGKLGNGGTTGSVTKPTKVFDDADDPQSKLTASGTVTDLTAGAHFVCAVKDNYFIYCWGDGQYGALGNNASASSSLPVRTVQGAIASDVVHISAGGLHTCYSAANNEIWCWGYGYYGQIGDGTTYQTSMRPYKVQTNADSASSQLPSGVDILAVSSGYYHTCVLASDGAAYCWGRNLEGQLGTNNGTVLGQNPRARKVRNYAENTDSELPAGVKFVSLASGKYHSCALGDDDNIYCWGRGTGGQLGDGAPYTSGTAIRVRKDADDTRSALPASATINFLVAGDSSCAVTEYDGTYCWGVGSDGQMGNGTTTASNPWAVQVDTELPLTITLVNANGAAGCTITDIDSAGKWVKCTTSAHIAGLVNVVVSNGTQSIVINDGYLYGKAVDPSAPHAPNAGVSI